MATSAVRATITMSRVSVRPAPRTGKKHVARDVRQRAKSESPNGAKPRALISVSDKTGMTDLAEGLNALGYEVVSTGGSAKAISDVGVEVTTVDQITSFPEMLDGRVKTLHPAVHGGILARRDLETHVEAVKKHDIGYIDVVAVNLYPFRETVASGGDFAKCVENIDIGGPAMIRAAAKNHPFVYVLVDSADYKPLIAHIKSEPSPEDDLKFRKRLAWKAYQHCASYDSVVSEYLWSEIGEGQPAPASTSLETSSREFKMADSTDDEEYEYDEQASVSEDYPDESEDEQSEDVEEEEDEPEPAPAPAAPTVSASAAPFVPASQAAPAPPAPAPAPTPPAPGANPTAQVSDPTEIRALQALNLMATGVMTRDLALVEGARSAAEFAARVRSIADAQPAPSRPSDEAVRRLTTDLAPLAARLGKFQTRPNDAMAEPADFDRSAEPAAAVPTPAPATSSAAPTLPVPARVAQPPPPVVPEDELSADPGDKEAMTAAKLQSLRVNLLRIATRLGQSPRNTVVAQVIYRLELAEQLKSGKKQPAAPAGRGSTTSFDRAVALAERKEKNDGADSDLGFTCTILLLGKSGTGKSSTINSLLGENTAAADAFRAETKKVRMVEHKMHGMTLRLIDTPGLQPSSSDISYNSKIMADAKRFTRRHKPDIVLYFDRMDQPARVDLADLPLLKTITATFGASVWFNAIVVLTHGSSAPPDGQNGQPISYEMYFAQRSHVVQQIIRQAAGDMRLMNPVALAENHPMCRTNRAGERVLPNGQVWMPQLLLLCFASKILTEANSLLNLQEQNAKAAKAAAQQQKVPPLPFLLSNLITSRKPFKLVGDDDDEYDDASDIILGAPSPYDVPKDQQEEMLPPKQVAVPAPDPQLPPSFDGESVGHRYRFLEPTSQWMVRPIVEAHGWDHESGIEGFSVDKGFVVFNKHPGNMSGQLTKDKKDSNVGFEGGVSVHHTKKLVTTTGVDVQTVGKQLAYTARGETRWKFCAVNKIAAGLSASLVGGALALGTKLENRWKVTPGAKLVVSAGAVSANKDVAYGGNCEAILRHSDDPGNPNSSTVGMSFMNWRGDVALGGNAMSSITLGRDTQLTARANLNSRGAGQLTLRATTNERLQLASLGLVPLLAALIGRIRGD